MDGKIVTINRANSIMKKNGADPIKISFKLFPEMAFNTKTFTPTGGVRSPISVSITRTTPNQSASWPKSRISGNIAGRVISMAEIPSMKQPRKIYSKKMRPKIPHAGRLERPTNIEESSKKYDMLSISK